jgi:lysozyme
MFPEYRIYETLKFGLSDPQVLALQRALPAWASGGVALTPDGVFGDKTLAAVRVFQESMNLKVDGVVGCGTATALRLWCNTDFGFDVSRFNQITWSKVDTKKYKFVNVKATEGATYIDPTFHASMSAAIDVGLTTSVYHYTKFANTPAFEVGNLAGATESFRRNITTYYLDLEHRETALSAAEIAAWVDEFAWRAATLFDPWRVGIYTSSNYLREMGLQGFKGFADNQLWAASWGTQPLVSPWAAWDVWQFTNSGSEEWCNGPIDLNRRALLQ